MIRYDKEAKMVVMDLVDLEHCGFNLDEFAGELQLAGVEQSALWPTVLLVRFRGGVVLSGRDSLEFLEETREEARRAEVAAGAAWSALLETL